MEGEELFGGRVEDQEAVVAVGHDHGVTDVAENRAQNLFLLAQFFLCSLAGLNIDLEKALGFEQVASCRL
jgi:hypothetical protein